MKYLILIMSVVISACFTNQSAYARNAHLQIVTTTAHIADIVKNLKREDERLEHIMGAATNPHTYNLSRTDIVKLEEADIIFYNGLGLEKEMQNTLDRLSKEKPVIAVGEKILGRFLIKNLNAQGFDPHIWMNVETWIHAVRAVRNGLTTIQPHHRTHYHTRSKNYIARLENLDKYIRATITTIPIENRTLITSSDAFQYFGNTYGLETFGIENVVNNQKPTNKRLNNMIELAKANTAKTLFLETSVNERPARSLVKKAREKGLNIKIGGELFSGAMGPGGTPESTYIGMMEHNVITITNALGGKARAYKKPTEYF